MHFGSVFVFVLVAQYLAITADALACYQCVDATSPTSCYTLANCSAGENCFTEEFTENNNIRFKLGCRSFSECVKPSQQSVSTIIGKRYTDTSGQCRQCCGVDECNTHLCSTATSHTGNSDECTDDPNFDCVSFSGVLNLCSDVQHAKTVCRKFCGLCILVDGNWSEWTAWSNCDVTCGQGQRSRSRTCSNPPPSSGGEDCRGDNIDKEICDTGEQCPVHGQWSIWSPWGICSVSCGIGQERRDRTCSHPYPKYGGDYCTGDTRDDRHCFEKACSDGGWSTWSSWDQCSATCDSGLTHKHRQCTNPTPSQFGKACDGDATDSKLCFLKSCDVDGGWTQWSSWSSCSETCGVGLQTKTRTCTHPVPSPHGQQCLGNDMKTMLCHHSSRCPDTIKSNVAFLVRTVSDTSPGTNTQLVFTNVIHNTDNSYSTSTGQFTAPVGGTYSFSTQICGYKSQYVNFRIYVNDVTMSDTTQYDPDSYTCTSSNTVAILSKGDRVYVKTGPGTSSGTVISQGTYRWSMFMGSLVN